MNWKIPKEPSIRKSTQKIVCITGDKGAFEMWGAFAFKIHFIFMATECRVSRIAWMYKEVGEPNLLRFSSLNLSSSTLRIIPPAAYSSWTRISCQLHFSTHLLIIIESILPCRSKNYIIVIALYLWIKAWSIVGTWPNRIFCVVLLNQFSFFLYELSVIYRQTIIEEKCIVNSSNQVILN